MQKSMRKSMGELRTLNESPLHTRGLSHQGIEIMAENEIKEGSELEQSDPSPARRRFLTRRKAFLGLGSMALLGLLISLIGLIAYKYGVFDNYVKTQFGAKMADIGIVFDADVFRVTLNPLELELKNATFNDKVSGEKLFFIRDAHLNLSVKDLYSWQLARDVILDKTDVNGAEAWVTFDENGKSNFSNLKLIEDQKGSAVNFKYDSVDFSLKDSVVHFGDKSRKISGNAKNVVFLLSPEDRDVADDQKRYKFDLASTDSNFIYEERAIEKIDIRAQGIAHKNGAELTRFDINTPIGEMALTGTLTDWASPKYAFDINSSVDLTQASSIMPLGTSLVGVGNFMGKVTGEGESNKVDGEIFTESLRADGVSLKGANVVATVSGTNSNYEADGTAIAQLLTFDDFRIDLLKLAGNVRGTGTDFRWVGELQAAAAKKGDLTLGGLFLSDALAEYKDKQIRAEAGNGRAKRFAIGDVEFEELAARNLKLSQNGGAFSLNSASATTRSFKTKDLSLQGVTGRNVTVKHRDGLTEVGLDGARSEAAAIKDAKVRNASADKFRFKDLPNSTAVTLENLRADQVTKDGVIVNGVETPLAEIENTRAGLVIYADRSRVAKIDTGAAVLGSLNIGGVRVTIRQGRVEARSNDIDAGNVALKKTTSLPDGGKLEAVKIARPVFILEPSGRYRATADMTLGGGLIGSVALGAASAKVEANNDSVLLNDLNADVMDGKLNGNAMIALNDRGRSSLKGLFSDLDISKLIALQGGSLTPIEGKTTGDIDLTFNGTNFRNASGTLNAAITANAGTAERGLIPVNGDVRLTATNGLFNVDRADLNTEKSKLTATGRFDLKDENSDLNVALRSMDAAEIDRLVRVLDLSPALEEQLNSMEVQVAGNLNFDGMVKGNLTDPIVDGKASLDSIALRGRELGRVTTDVFVSPDGVDLKNGKLVDGSGGNAEFAVNMPRTGSNNVAIKATLTNVNAGNLLAALPITLPEQIRDLNGQTSGTVDITGLPNESRGEVNLLAKKGIIAGQVFDGLNVKAVFNGTTIDLQQADMRIGAGQLTAKGTYDRAAGNFNFSLVGKSVPVPLVIALLPRSDNIPVITGDLDFAANATGNSNQTASYNINFSGIAPNVQVGDNILGQVVFKGQTANQILTADLTATLDGRPQVINATANFGSEDLPFMVATDFNQNPLAPFLAFVPQLKGMAITGTGTGRVEFGGNLSQLNDKGVREFSTSALTGKAEFSQLAMLIQDTPLSAAEPILVRFNPREVVFEKARFSGGGSNMTITGAKALTDAGINNLAIDGRVNLNLINLFVKDTFFSGFADAAVRFSGPNKTALISGTANVVNGSVATFLGSDRFTVDRLKARVIFTSNQVEIEEAAGYLGGGRFTGSGGGTLDGFAVQRFRFTLDGKNVTVPLPKDFVTTGDARLEITGLREAKNENLQLIIGGRVFARRAVYSKDIDLANLVSGRRDPVLSGGGAGAIKPPRFDLVIEGRDALVVKNNIADLTASVSLTLTGDTNEPRLSGRITANSGTILFRKDRYVVQRGVLEFPPDTAIEPVINLQAESEIGGYQVFVNLAGPLKDSEELSATVRSSPALPQADVVSLITTGSLTNAAGGIPTLASTGINTAAEILTDSIINNPARKATDKLFGLNVFEIDPLISGQTVNPGARLTVGRQINNNLRVTYSTNLSQDQNQVLALEYRVSNKLSFVAQYEQRSLTNVTRNRDNFSFEIRFRRRF
ncbi:MAG TPA: translocation/assembly module TamB domain-containing protein [Pyrinomonadaceae bacterium]|nr:translocation/assembly module TamB domain-containing protein [Pyrinomonadaceae bacterium]